MHRQIPSNRSSDTITRHAQPDAPQLSVIMCTYNRGELLEDAVRSVLTQQHPATPPFEFIVVDNNSTDDTREIIERLAAVDGRLRYAFEPRQGLSFARNEGIRQARAPLVAFTDDDVRVEPDWVMAIIRAFREHPEADLIGGRVLPIWPFTPPAWLTRDHWAPLALVDHGEAIVPVTTEHAICPVGANLVCRREVFDAVGVFATGFQRVKDGIGSLEDHEFLLRFLRTGRSGLYDPRIVVHAEVQPDRLTRRYHRRWHTGHGHYHALLRSEHMEQTSVGRLMGVPAHMYRQALVDLAGWMRASATGQSAAAFRHEVRLRFFRGFFRTRRREFFDKLAHELALRRRPTLSHPANTSTGQGHR